MEIIKIFGILGIFYLLMGFGLVRANPKHHKQYKSFWGMEMPGKYTLRVLGIHLIIIEIVIDVIINTW